MSFLEGTDMANHKYNTRSKKIAPIIPAANIAEPNIPAAANIAAPVYVVPSTTSSQQSSEQSSEISSDADDDEEYDLEDDEDDDEDDDEEDDDEDDDDDDDDEEEEDEEEEDVIDYNELLASIFPSSYMERKLREDKAGYMTADAYDYDNDNKRKRSASPLQIRYKNKFARDSTLTQPPAQLPQLFNIVLNITDSIANKKTEDEETMEDEVEEEDTVEEDEPLTVNVEENTVNIEEQTVTETSPCISAVDESASKLNATEAFRKMDAVVLASLSPTERNHPVMKKFMVQLKTAEKNYARKQQHNLKKKKEANTEKFRQLLREKNVMNDVQYFQENMDLAQQERALTQIQELLTYSDISKPYRLALLEAPIPLEFKVCAYRRLASLRFMEPGGGEYHKIKNWVDTFMRIPFGVHKTLPLTLANGVEVCHEFMDNAKKVLDAAVYGLNDAKLQIMQMVGQWIVNPSAIGSAIAIKGPMGTGKTTLVKEGISKILGRDFAFIALGGATDSSFLEGHSYTYEGSSWGKIVDIIIKSKCMNPVIYFDELDKVSDTPKGEEIIGVLTHLTDTTQNSKFHDKYFAELEFDLSRCLFIFSYNDESKINPILRDRMYRIQTKGYDLAQKTNIAINYLLPKIREQVCFNPTDVVFPEETIHYIINHLTEKEDGVRTLKRCLEIIHTKLNLYRLMKPGTNLFEADLAVVNVVFPMTVTSVIVDKLIKLEQDVGAWTSMYM